MEWQQIKTVCRAAFMLLNAKGLWNSPSRAEVVPSTFRANFLALNRDATCAILSTEAQRKLKRSTILSLSPLCCTLYGIIYCNSHCWEALWDASPEFVSCEFKAKLERLFFSLCVFLLLIKNNINSVCCDVKFSRYGLETSPAERSSKISSARFPIVTLPTTEKRK